MSTSATDEGELREDRGGGGGGLQSLRRGAGGITIIEEGGITITEGLRCGRRRLAGWRECPFRTEIGNGLLWGSKIIFK